MDSFNIFLDCSISKPSRGQIHYSLREIGFQTKPELVIVNGDFEIKEFLPQFQDLLGLKVSNFRGTMMENLVQFCRDFPSDWVMNVLPNRKILDNVVDRYKQHWSGGVDQVFLPASNGDFDFSGHLLVMNYFAYRKLEGSLTLPENLYELTRQGVKFVGTQGVTIYEERVRKDRIPRNGVSSGKVPGDGPRDSNPAAKAAGGSHAVSAT